MVLSKGQMTTHCISIIETHWDIKCIVIYKVDSAIHTLSNWSLVGKMKQIAYLQSSIAIW